MARDPSDTGASPCPTLASVFSAEPPVSGGHGLSPEALLAGPRGRRLCVDLLDDRLTALGGRVRREWADACYYARRPHRDARRCAGKLHECVRIADPAGSPFDGGTLMASLQMTVSGASYWEQPAGEDVGFADAAAWEALRPVAHAVAVAVAGLPEVRWWAKLLDGSRQRCTQFLGEHPQQQPQLGGTAGLARAWREDTREDEQSGRSGPRDVNVFYSGRWWSSPALSGLPVTTRRMGGAGLALVEDADGRGWQLARCWPVTAQDGARVFEISGPEHWAALVERYPLEVTRSRRPDWRQATGWAGRWMIPDYAAVAADWDAIHVTVAGYLTTAGVVMPAGADARTMLAGWDPDATWWLSDVLSFTGPPEDWREEEDAPFGWIQI